MVSGEKIKRFQIELNEAITGMVGLGINGNTKSFFGGIKISPNVEKTKHVLMDSEKVTYNSILDGINYSKYLAGCNRSTSKLLSAITKCDLPEDFCDKECAKQINPIENILFYQCFKLCRDKARLEIKSNPSLFEKAMKTVEKIVKSEMANLKPTEKIIENKALLNELVKMQPEKNEKINVENYPSIQIGSKNEYVSKMKKILKEKGYYKGNIDNDFENNTKAAVIAYQKANKDVNGKQLAPDGICGPKTWKSLLQ